MFCTNCGAEIDNGAEVCPGCGTKIGDVKSGADKKTCFAGKIKCCLLICGVLIFSGMSVKLTKYFTDPEYRYAKMIERAENHLERGNYEKAVAAYEKALEYMQEGGDDKAQEGLTNCYLGMADKFYEAGNDEEAMNYYEMAKQIDNTKEEIYLGKAAVYLRRDQVREAVYALENGKSYCDSYALTAQMEYIKDHVVITRKVIYDGNANIEWQWEYEYDDNGNPVRERGVTIEGEIIDWKEYNYDFAGNKISCTWYNENADMEMREDYDAAGNIVKSVLYNADGSIGQWYEYEYNVEGNLVKKSLYDKYSIILAWDEYEYDARGNLVKESWCDENGIVGGWLEHEYDMASNEVKCTEYKGNGDLWSWWECEYDFMGNQLKYISHWADGSMWMHWEAAYDIEGNQERCVYYNADGNVENIWEYEYDEASNQTKGSFYDAEGNLLDLWITIYDRMGNEVFYSQGSLVRRCGYDYHYVFSDRTISEDELAGKNDNPENNKGAGENENISDFQPKSIWFDGVEFKILSYLDEYGMLVKFNLGDYLVQAIVPRALESENFVSEYYIESWDGVEEVYLNIVSEDEDKAFSFGYGKGEGIADLWDEFQGDYETFYAPDNKFGIIDGGMGEVIMDKYDYEPYLPGYAAFVGSNEEAMAFAAQYLDSDENAGERNKEYLTQTVFRQSEESDFENGSELLIANYSERIQAMYEKYRELEFAPDDYLIEQCNASGTDYSRHYLWDLTADNIPEIIYLGDSRSIIVAGENNCVELFGNGIIFSDEPGIFYLTNNFWVEAYWDKYQVTTGQDGMLSIACINEKYLYTDIESGFYMMNGEEISEEQFNTALETIENRYRPHPKLYDRMWDYIAGKKMFENTPKRLTDEVVFPFN